MTLWLILALLVMLIGLAGTLLPAIPGLPLIGLAMWGYGALDGFRHVTLGYLILVLLVIAGAQVAEHYARAFGAKRFGASRAGTWGAVIGSLAGLFFLPVGLLLGPFLGAMLGELVAGRRAEDAFRAGLGGMVGVLGSIAMNAVLGIALILSFLFKVTG